MCRTSDAHSAEKSCSSEQNGDSFPQRTGSLSSIERTLRRKEKKSFQLIEFLKHVKYLPKSIHKSRWKLQDRTPLANSRCPQLKSPKSTFDFFQFMCRMSDAHSAQKSCSSEQNSNSFPQRTGSLNSTTELCGKRSFQPKKHPLISLEAARQDAISQQPLPLIEEPKSTFDFFQFMCKSSDVHSAQKSCSSEQNGDSFPQRTGSLSSTKELCGERKKGSFQLIKFLKLVK
ncbi:hypothetical protein CEXT_668411 [Caerostris extrusa]|uniref:Uncharacterized protein n=1 Tax=Caerostris extrusa TaxID=172846 RepID=A0AAV4UBM9_CAEEX|nr:hypothetical protein CEXT_668411 [Caerostris extrusa]